MRWGRDTGVDSSDGGGSGIFSASAEEEAVPAVSTAPTGGAAPAASARSEKGAPTMGAAPAAGATLVKGAPTVGAAPPAGTEVSGFSGVSTAPATGATIPGDGA